jgi:sulfite exporter TauE/SafE
MHNLDSGFSTSYLVAFVMGLFSALHCLGMCGSIIGTLTLSLRKEVRENKTLLLPFVLSYNFGRITSYTLAGFLAGLLHNVLMLPLGEGQGHRILQIISALIMAGAGLHIAGWFPRFAYIEKGGAVIWHKIEPYGRRLIPVSTHLQAYAFGMIWGWLPCGLVYAAVTLAATAGNEVRGALTMLAFGIGTLPAVVSVGVMTSLMMRLSAMKNFRQAAGISLILLALLAAFPWINPWLNVGGIMHGLHGGM